MTLQGPWCSLDAPALPLCGDADAERCRRACCSFSCCCGRPAGCAGVAREAALPGFPAGCATGLVSPPQGSPAPAPGPAACCAAAAALTAAAMALGSGPATGGESSPAASASACKWSSTSKAASSPRLSSRNRSASACGPRPGIMPSGTPACAALHKVERMVA